MLWGVMTMMRTMICAIILLFLIVYFLSIVLVSLLGTDIDSEHELVYGQTDLFSTVPRSMLTVFRCIVLGDCSAGDGTPIALQLSESVGWVFMIAYCSISILML